MSDLALPIPRALYSCALCSEEYSWPAEDLFWCELCQEWICRECWKSELNERGISLADEIKRQEKNAIR